ncbi:MAG: THUMP domain-containing protein [Bacteroidales bacterium]|nr:THUMP domain-containing protein [Bacteroidales bacterium]
MIPSTTYFRIIVKTFAGLEPVLADEISTLGGQQIEPINRAVAFVGDKKLLYRANYELRTALRVLVPIAKFNIKDENQLYDAIQQLNWHEYFGVDQTFAVDAVVGGSVFTHSQYVTHKTKDAIVDQFRNRFGNRPSINTLRPDLRVHIHIQGNELNILLDSSGESLHKRGYRYQVDKAPINEVLAAGLILLSGWKGDSNFVDAMCGSGTIPIEAVMIAMHIPAGYYRDRFGFMSWKDFDKSLWEEVWREAGEKMTDCSVKILASDRSGRAVDIAKNNMQKAHVHKDILLLKKDMSVLIPPPAPGIAIMNPPYGQRLEEKDLKQLYSGIGDSLKKQFTGYKAWIISSDIAALKHVGLKPSKRITVFNGPLECRFVEYELFAGTHKDHKTNVSTR